MTVLKIRNEMHRLKKIRHKTFPKEDKDNLADFDLINQQAKKASKIIDYVVNSITQE